MEPFDQAKARISTGVEPREFNVKLSSPGCESTDSGATGSEARAFCMPELSENGANRMIREVHLNNG